MPNKEDIEEELVPDTDLNFYFLVQDAQSFSATVHTLYCKQCQEQKFFMYPKSDRPFV